MPHLILYGHASSLAHFPAISLQHVEHTSDWEAFETSKAPVKIDLDFDQHNRLVDASNAGLVLAQSLLTLGGQLPGHYGRINAWPGFVQRGKMELFLNDPLHKPQATEALQALGFAALWVPDQLGLVAARLVAGICLEAKLALQDNLATTLDIDTAMKLGTNYPFGPFEWMDMLGEERTELLLQLAEALTKNQLND